MEKKRIIGYYDYTVILTYVGMVFGFIGILDLSKESYTKSVICLMIAGICDMFDGAVASTKKRNMYEKQFGIQIDSLCDLINFGVLPALFVCLISGRNKLICGVACVYTLCGLIRLAYFNVQEMDRQNTTDAKRDVYLGLPITSSALVLPFCYILYSQIEFIGIWIFMVMLILLGIGFIHGIEIKKPRITGKIILIIIGVMEMAGILILSGANLI